MPWVKAEVATKGINIKVTPIYETDVEIKPGGVTEFKYKIKQ